MNRENQTPTEKAFIKKRCWFENNAHKLRDTIGDQQDSISGKGKNKLLFSQKCLKREREREHSTQELHWVNHKKQ